MHDPMTVAFEIKSPIRQPDKHFPDGWRNTLVTIWHVDPESNGSDDSCGFSIPHLSKRQVERLKSFAWSEARDPYFMRSANKDWRGSRAEAEVLYRGLLLQVARMIGVKMSFEEAAKEAALTIHTPDCTDSANVFCFLPGYHSNWPQDRPEDREDVFLRKTIGIARWMLADRRPWYRHPRWHFWHWEIQVVAVQNFKRWAFSKCAECGKGFPWGSSPVSSSWHSTGPLWFRSERGVMHMSCDRARTMKPRAAA